MQRIVLISLCSAACAIFICQNVSVVWKVATKIEDIFITLNVQHDTEIIYSLFYVGSSGEDFTEKYKKVIRVGGGKELQKVKIRLNGVSMITRLRLDFDNPFQSLKLGAIQIDGEESITLLAEDISKSNFANMESVKVDREILKILSVEPDPHIIFLDHMVSMRGKVATDKTDYYLLATIFIVSFLVIYRVVNSLLSIQNSIDKGTNYSPPILVKYQIKRNEGFYVNFIFLLVLLFLIVIPMTKISEERLSEKENRLLAPKPPLLTAEGFNYLFGEKFEKYFNDRFRKRGLLISLKDRVDDLIRGDRIDTDFMFSGSEGWFFYKQEGSVENYQNRNRFNIDELETIYQNLQRSHQWFERRGIAYYIFIPPDKSRVYPEYYPQWVNIVHPESRLEQLRHYLELKTCSLRLVTPHEKLRNHKDELVYFKGDTHWNSYGAYWGYSVLLEEVTKKYPSVFPLTISDFDLDQYQAKIGYSDLLMKAPISEKKIQQHLKRTTYKNPLLKNGNAYKVQQAGGDFPGSYYTSNPKRKLRVLAVHDSFMTVLAPYISETFGEVYFLPQYDSLRSQVMSQFIIDKKIDIVILEIVERDIVLLANKSIPFPGVTDGI